MGMAEPLERALAVLKRHGREIGIPTVNTAGLVVFPINGINRTYPEIYALASEVEEEAKNAGSA